MAYNNFKDRSGMLANLLRTNLLTLSGADPGFLERGFIYTEQK